jgi:hypothetical protein
MRCRCGADSFKWNKQAGVTWHNSGFSQTDRNPVVCVRGSAWPGSSHEAEPIRVSQGAYDDKRDLRGETMNRERALKVVLVVGLLFTAAKPTAREARGCRLAQPRNLLRAA